MHACMKLWANTENEHPHYTFAPIIVLRLSIIDWNTSSIVMNKVFLFGFHAEMLMNDDVLFLGETAIDSISCEACGSSNKKKESVYNE